MAHNIALTTPLVIDNINLLLEQLSLVISPNQSVILDLSIVPNIDSAGIALLVELKKIAKKNQCALQFINPTIDIKNLCQLYQVVL
jgi:ABC-type transporter Mla MlaB component